MAHMWYLHVTDSYTFRVEDSSPRTLQIESMLIIECQGAGKLHTQPWVDPAVSTADFRI